MLKNNKGITLASLVITIIVLIILASVATVSGLGAVDYIKFNNAKAQFQTMQAQVNSWYEEYKEVDEDKKEEWLENYGVPVKDPSCDQEKAAVTATPVGGDLTGYRYFSSTYIKDTLDIDGISYDFLINIKQRSVLLFGGITYQDYTYYTAEDFGIDVINYEDLSGDITFYTAVEDGAIIVYNIQFAEGLNVSKYSVQYQLKGEEYWKTLTSDMKREYTYEVENEDGEIQKITDNNSWYIEIDMPTELIDEYYNVKIITASDKVASSDKEVIVNWKGVVTKTKKILVDSTNEKTIAVPEGFYILEYSESPINDGVVVVAPDGSEFVWVPVEDISTMYGSRKVTLEDGTIQHINSGKLYDWTNLDDEGSPGNLNWTETDGVMSWKSDTGYRESDILINDEHGDSSTLDNQGLKLLISEVRIEGTIEEDNEEMLNTWKTQLQNEFDEMIKYVELNKGFYVGRYETSYIEKTDENDSTIKIAQSMRNKNVATASTASANTWYGLYQLQKDYSKNHSLTNAIGSTMIWGSQYDQMMIWMKNNEIDITSTTPIEGAEYNTTKIAGSVETDKLNNVYDLIGSCYEWTLEAHNNCYRVMRGRI